MSTEGIKHKWEGTGCFRPKVQGKKVKVPRSSSFPSIWVGLGWVGSVQFSSVQDHFSEVIVFSPLHYYSTVFLTGWWSKWL